VPLFSPTPEGKRIRSYAYVERETATGWGQIAGVATKANGSYALFVPKAKLGARYRVLVPGPNVGTTLAPDAASAPVPSAR
jgi:1,4-alpha-glucan branching enzyme